LERTGSLGGLHTLSLLPSDGIVVLGVTAVSIFLVLVFLVDNTEGVKSVQLEVVVL
jgi:hypothetical protein